MIEIDKVPLWPETETLPWIEIGPRVDETTGRASAPYRMTRIVTRTADGQLHSAAVAVYDTEMRVNWKQEMLVNLIKVRLEAGMMGLKDHVENYLAAQA